MASLTLNSIAIRSYAFSIVVGEINCCLLPLFFVVVVEVGGGDVLDLQDMFRRFAFETIRKISFRLTRDCLELSMMMAEFAAMFDTTSLLLAW
ncbi:Cytochrome P450 [Canna indica]|uniref:Cytochrome P450 n=1 Tax=Canna indica TaxID=4628 RepID=A0AAQ3JMR1_9LILI|nr:Cytochrome P450 [Canna indica]